MLPLVVRVYATFLLYIFFVFELHLSALLIVFADDKS